MVLKRLARGPSGSSLIWTSDFMGTGLQLHVGSIVTSSNSELLKQEVEKVGLFFENQWAQRGEF